MRGLAAWLLMGVVWAPQASAYDTVEVAHPASLQGRVVLGSGVEIDRTKDTFASPALFGHPRNIMRDLKVDGAGGVAGALVVVIDAEQGAPPVAAPLELVNEDLAFLPRMQATGLGADLSIVNKDEVFHNVHAYQHRRNLFNVAMPRVGAVLHHKLRRTGLISVRCDVSHEWMTAFIYVSPHPYVAVTDPAGHFHIDGLPPGDYHVAAWHEWLGELAPVAVHVDQTVEQDLVYRTDNRIAEPSIWLLGEE